jgi:hypothetical protein
MPEPSGYLFAVTMFLTGRLLEIADIVKVLEDWETSRAVT